MARPRHGTGFKRREREEEPMVDLGDACVLVHQTAKAALFEIEGEEHWVPLSVVGEGSAILKGEHEKGGKGLPILPQWFARKEGLVFE